VNPSLSIYGIAVPTSVTMAGDQESELVDLTEAADPAQPEQKRAKTLTGFFSVYDLNNDMGRTLTSLLWHSSQLPRNARTCIVYSCHFVNIGGPRMGHGQSFVRFGPGQTGHLRIFELTTVSLVGATFLNSHNKNPIIIFGKYWVNTVSIIELVSFFCANVFLQISAFVR
jgi:hypothetical protein